MQPQTAAPTRTNAPWRVHPDARLRFRYWDGECVLYHGAAGDTHRVPASVGHVLGALVAAAASIDDLSIKVDLHEDDVEGILNTMHQLGIVERQA